MRQQRLCFKRLKILFKMLKLIFTGQYGKSYIKQLKLPKPNNENGLTPDFLLFSHAPSLEISRITKPLFR